MMNHRYSFENGQLVISEALTGHLVHRETFEAPVREVLPLPNADACLVLLDPDAANTPFTFENLFKVGPDGRIEWKAQLPQSHNCFVSVTICGDYVKANTWSGHRVEIDLATGQTRKVTFVK